MTLRIAVLPRARVGAIDRAQIEALCSAAFEVRYGDFLEAFGATTHVLGWDDGLLVAHALWITRTLRLGVSRSVRSAYVEAVVTQPAYQRRGYGTLLMRRLQCHLGAYDLGALATRAPVFYESLGWQQWLGPLYVERDGQLTASPDECVMVFPGSSGQLPDRTTALTVPWRPLACW